MRLTVRIAGLAAAAALVLWCATIAIRSFTPRPGAGLPRLDGGVGIQLPLGVAALVTAGLIVAAAFALTRPTDREPRLLMVVCLLGWAAVSIAVAAHAAELFLAPEDYEGGVGAGVASTVAPAWEAWFWTVGAVCAALACGLLVRRALARHVAPRVSRPTV